MEGDAVSCVQAEGACLWGIRREAAEVMLDGKGW